MRAILTAQRVVASGGQRAFPAPEALYFADPGVGIKVGQGEEFVAGILDPVSHLQPVQLACAGVRC